MSNNDKYTDFFMIFGIHYVSYTAILCVTGYWKLEIEIKQLSSSSRSVLPISNGYI